VYHNSGSFSQERLAFNSRAISMGHAAHRMPMVFSKYFGFALSISFHQYCIFIFYRLYTPIHCYIKQKNKISIHTLIT
jgi:hypothetical protein